MSKLLLVPVSLFALGIGIILFEGLVANNHANFHPCSRDMICDFVVAQDPISIGVFPVIVGAIMFGLQKAMKRTKILDSIQE